MICATGRDPERMAADGEITTGDLDELQRFRRFLKDMSNHCPECLEPFDEVHTGPGTHADLFEQARAKWGLVLTNDEVRRRCLLGWQTYAQGRVRLNDIAGLRRGSAT